MKRRIVQIIRPGTGGSAESLRLLLERIDRDAFEIDVIASPLEDPSYPETLASLGFQVHLIPIERAIRPASDAHALLQIVHLLARLRPHVIHAHTSKPGFFVYGAAWCARRLPKFFSGGAAGPPSGSMPRPRIIYSPHGPYFRYGLSRPQRTFYRGLEQIARLSTDQVVAIAQSEAEEIVAAGVVPRHKVCIIPNGIDLDRYRTLPDPTPLLDRFRIPPQTIRLGSIGRLDPPKDPFTLLEATRILTRDRPDLRLLLVGTGSMEEAVDRRIRDLDLEKTVVRTGFLACPEALALLDVSILSSTSEGMPLVLLESMAAGKPVVSSDLPGCREALLGGRCGPLVPLRDPVALAEAIATTLDERELRTERIETAQRHVQSHHTLEEWVRKIEALYR